MACTPPGTLSLGYVFLDYTTNSLSVPHRTRIRLTNPIDPADVATIRTAATSWANFMAGCLSGTSWVIGWGTMNPDGSIFYIEAFNPFINGTHPTSVGAAALRSRTLTLTGKGFPVSGGQCAGQTRTVIYVTEAFEWSVGQKTFVVSSDAAVEALRDFLTGNSVLGADFYGNVGNWRPAAPVQYNSYTQRKLGT